MLRSLVEAQQAVLEAMTKLPVEAVPLDDALGLVLAADVVAPHDVPPFANSAMDGFAVIAADTAPPPAGYGSSKMFRPAALRRCG